MSPDHSIHGVLYIGCFPEKSADPGGPNMLWMIVPEARRFFQPSYHVFSLCIPYLSDSAGKLITGMPAWPVFPCFVRNASSGIGVVQTNNVAGVVSKSSEPPSWAK